MCFFRGSLAILDGVQATVTESTFTRCSGGQGGAIYVARGCTLALDGVLFTFNDATKGTGKGGAVYASENCTVLVEGTTFEDNTGTRGPAFFVESYDETRRSFVLFTNGVRIARGIARLYGSAVSIYGAGAELEARDGVVFEENLGAVWGGPTYLYGAARFVARGDVVFRNNVGTGACMSAILVSPSCTTELYAGVWIHDNVEFRGGTTSLFGGAICAHGIGAIVLASGAINIERNTVMGVGGGAIKSYMGSTFLSNGVSISYNMMPSGAGFFNPREGLMETGINLFDNISISHNVAYLGDGGGGTFSGTTSLSHVLFRNNTAAYGKGGALMADTLSRVTVRNCVFVDNTAADGGALAGAGSGASVTVMSSVFERNRALKKGGCVYLDGSCALTLCNHTKLAHCIAASDGGGASTHGESKLTIRDGVIIERCASLHGSGGGMQIGGASLDVHLGVVVQNNRATRGGGVSFMAPVRFRGMAHTRISHNVASEHGGGLYGFSSFAQLTVAADHSLSIENNVANRDGGGLALGRGGMPCMTCACVIHTRARSISRDSLTNTRTRAHTRAAQLVVIYISIYLYLSIYLSIYLYIYIYIALHIYIYIHLYVCVYTHT